MKTYQQHVQTRIDDIEILRTFFPMSTELLDFAHAQCEASGKLEKVAVQVKTIAEKMLNREIDWNEVDVFCTFFTNMAVVANATDMNDITDPVEMLEVIMKFIGVHTDNEEMMVLEKIALDTRNFGVMGIVE